MKDAEKNNCGKCAKKRALQNAQNGNQQSKDWVTFGVVFGGCIGSVFYINRHPSPQKIDAQFS